MAKVVKLFRGKPILVGEARASYAYVFTPREDEKGQPTSYGVTLMFPKNGNAFVQKSIKTIQEQIDLAFADIIEQKLKTAKQVELMKQDVKTCAWRDGDGDWNDPSLESHKPEYLGHWILCCSNKFTDPATGGLLPPKVFYSQKDGGGEIKDSRDFVSGDYCFSKIVISAYNNQQTGVTAFFNSIMKSRSGEPFGAGAARESDYAEIADEFPDDDTQGGGDEKVFD